MDILIKGSIKQCLIGKKIYRLLVLELTDEKIKTYLCRCDCGVEKKIAARNLVYQTITSRGTRSCGCLKKEVVAKRAPRKAVHGHCINNTTTRTYNSWDGLMKRCYDKKQDNFYNYGGRGITVCERWHDFKNFLEDMGERPLNTSIDRKDRNGNYEPSNCRWGTQEEQYSNKITNRFFTYKGETKTVSQWSRIYGISKNTLRHRLNRNCPEELIFKKHKEDYVG